MNIQEAQQAVRKLIKWSGIDKDAAFSAAEIRGFRSNDGMYSGFTSFHTEGFADGAQWQHTQDFKLIESLLSIIEEQHRTLEVLKAHAFDSANPFGVDKACTATASTLERLERLVGKD